jgi:hypothetical protein
VLPLAGDVVRVAAGSVVRPAEPVPGESLALALG